jgi:hypothetical protein
MLLVLGMQPWFGAQLYVSGAHKVFDALGTLLEEQLRKRLRHIWLDVVRARVEEMQ